MENQEKVGWVQPAVLWHCEEGSFQEADSEGDGELLGAGQLHHHGKSVCEQALLYNAVTDLY